MASIYEQPWLLLIVSGAALLGTLVYRGLWPQKRKWRQWGFFVIIALAAFGIDFFVQTDVEKVRRVIVSGVKAAQREDVEAIGVLLADDYRDSFNGSKEALLSRLRSQIPEPIIEKNVLRIISLDVNSPKATSVFTVRVVFDPQGPVFEFRKQMILKFEAGLVKRGQEWFFRDVELLEIDLQPAGWKNIQGNPGEVFD